MKKYVLLIESPDEKGLISKVTQVLYEFSLNIDQNDEIVLKEHNYLFMRSVFIGEIERNKLESKIQTVLPKNSKFQLEEQRKKNIIIFATTETHCIGDIFIRYYSGDLDVNIVGVISNHNSIRELTEKFGIPYYFISTENSTRSEQENQILKILKTVKIDLIVLAKYMRILSENFVSNYEGKIINIHHSFLPAFKGANPYKQAYDLGVKIIGATSHFVNNNLDEGAIISQDIIPVTHKQTWEEMREAGRDIEKIVLSRAIKLFIQDKICIFKNKTIIFD